MQLKKEEEEGGISNGRSKSNEVGGREVDEPSPMSETPLAFSWTSGASLPAALYCCYREKEGEELVPNRRRKDGLKGQRERGRE